MIDRYTKVLLTIIATALLYLCIVLTPLPGVHAQGALRPGEPTPPLPVIVVGWRAPATEVVPTAPTRATPVTIAEPVQIRGPVEIRGNVTTERSTGFADRVVLVGWEESAIREKPLAQMRSITPAAPGIPVTMPK